MKPLELYIHIPFCRQKCNYCDFLSAPAGADEMQNYVEKLCEDIKKYTKVREEYQIVSIYVGGGTPSILAPCQMEQIFRAIRETFLICPDAEISIEMNPGTVTEDKLSLYYASGINRLSIGLQSVNDRELKYLGRIHTFRQFLDTYRMAREKGFSNINVDLISAIPGQTEESWEKTLRTVAELFPEHISAYSLIIEEGTPFYDIYGVQNGGCPGGDLPALPSEEEERRMYENTEEVLAEYGYHRYEISNYARKGFECRHNLGYWSRTEYLGIGVGASSFMNHRRWVSGESPKILTRTEEMEEFMFLGLRKMSGISKEAFAGEFGTSVEEIYADPLHRLKEQGLLEEQGDAWKLTKRGIDVSNYVLSEFLL